MHPQITQMTQIRGQQQTTAEEAGIAQISDAVGRFELIERGRQETTAGV
jgi:hypothetical protein